MSCSVIVRVLNEKENLNKLIKILETQQNVKFELIVIDSGSNDGTVEMLKDYKFKIPFIFTSIKKEEFTFGKSLNKAIEHSTYKDFIVSISAHCFPLDELYLNKMINYLNDLNVGLVFGRQIADSKSALSEANHLSKWFPKEEISLKNIFCNNGSSAFRYSDWKKIKFDQNITGCEDILFALELSNLGKEIVYEPNAPVTHFHNESFKVVFNRYRREANLIKTLFNHDLYLYKVFISSFKEIYSDILFRTSNEYPKSSLIEILKYRMAKNMGQYFGRKDIKKFNIDYSKDQKTDLLNHYFY